MDQPVTFRKRVYTASDVTCTLFTEIRLSQTAAVPGLLYLVWMGEGLAGGGEEYSCSFIINYLSLCSTQKSVSI